MADARPRLVGALRGWLLLVDHRCVGTMTELESMLLTRSGGACELCSSTESLTRYDVPSRSERDDTSVVICATCEMQLGDGAELDEKHWMCLQGAIWSEHAAVRVLSWRILRQLGTEVSWASQLLEEVYIPDDVFDWASEGGDDASTAEIDVRDSLGVSLVAGDSVTLIKDLDVKGTSFVAKRGTKVKGIRLSDDPNYVEGKVNGVSIMLKTEFLKRS